jgi:hypothetical protein
MKWKCFIDLDGVLADVHRHIAEQFGCPIPEVRPAPLGYVSDALGEGFWKTLDAEFWAAVPPTAWFKDLLEVMEAIFGEEVCILTDPMGLAPAMVGKVRWIERHAPGYAAHRVLLGSGKHFCAGPGKVLVDDSDANVAHFAADGGEGVLFPREWNGSHWINPGGRVAYVGGELAMAMRRGAAVAATKKDPVGLPYRV